MEQFPLASVSGIAAATLVIIALLKTTLAQTPVIRAIPIWIDAALVAIGLTVLAHYVLGTLSGDPLQLAWQACLAAATASGFREWWLTVTKPASASSAGKSPIDIERELAG